MRHDPKDAIDIGPLIEAVSEFASRAAEKLRGQGSHVREVLVFIRTSPFRKDAQYSRSTIVPLRRPCDDTSAIVHAAILGLRSSTLHANKAHLFPIKTST